MHILTLEEVHYALQECWNLLKPELNTKDVKTFKLTDFEVMESGLNDYFSGILAGVPSAGALLNLLSNGDSKRNRTVAIIALYVLLKRDLISEDEKRKVFAQKRGKSPLSDYTNRVTVLTKLKEYLTVSGLNDTQLSTDIVSEGSYTDDSYTDTDDSEGSYTDTDVSNADPDDPEGSNTDADVSEGSNTDADDSEGSYTDTDVSKADTDDPEGSNTDTDVSEGSYTDTDVSNADTDVSEVYKHTFLKPYPLYILAVVMIFFGLWVSSRKSIYVEGKDFTWEILSQQNGESLSGEVTLIYDLSKTSYKNAYIDFGDRVLRELKEKKGKLRYTITVPQGRKFTLIIDGQAFVKRSVIKTDGWIAKVDDLYFTQTNINRDGRMYLSPEGLPGSILKTGEYYVAYQKIENFDYDLNNIVFETRVKNPESEGGISCFDLSVDLNGFLGDSLTIVSFNLLKPGCTSWSSLRVGEVSLDPDNYDLRKSGIDLSDWKIVKGVLREKSFSVYVGDNLLYEVPFMADLGKLKFIQLYFKGSGSVDYFKLSDNSGTLLINDAF